MGKLESIEHNPAMKWPLKVPMALSDALSPFMP